MNVLEDDESRIYQATYGDAKEGDEEQHGDEPSPPVPPAPDESQPGLHDDLLALFINTPSKK